MVLVLHVSTSTLLVHQFFMFLPLLSSCLPLIQHAHLALNWTQTFVKLADEMEVDPGPSRPRTTASVLAEIQCGTAAELVMASRYSNAPPGPTFIPSLDTILGEARPHAGGSTLQRGDLVELIGSSGSGKTSLLNFLLLTHILPSEMKLTLPPPHQNIVTLQVPLGGRGVHGGILHPSTHRSPLPALVRLIRAHVTICTQDALTAASRSRVISPEIKRNIDAVIVDSLSRLRVVKFKPRTKSMVLALMTMLHPPSLHLSPGSWVKGDHAMDILVIDGFGDGFWPERWTEEGRSGARRPKQGVKDAEDLGMRDIVGLVEDIRKELGTVIVLSIQGLWSQTSSPFFTSHMASPYPAPFSPHRHDEGSNTSWPLNIQITMTGRVRPLQLPADLTLVDSLRGLEASALAREGQSQADLFEAIVRVPGGRGLSGTSNGLKFDWRIGRDGLEVWGQ